MFCDQSAERLPCNRYKTFDAWLTFASLDGWARSVLVARFWFWAPECCKQQMEEADAVQESRDPRSINGNHSRVGPTGDPCWRRPANHDARADGGILRREIAARIAEENQKKRWRRRGCARARR
ncbi:hypothetical protein MPL3356_350074 [Mesorhizobium plurifarium]|uniref:Uncharacterized protein n=1 Tax=Mesorhizobium plurifarium TaxID=69974 RepID=A0A090DWI0_MESPL|nr:hypothetical protein MPL3356_350074 [Mesorhizobium plurifarium]